MDLGKIDTVSTTARYADIIVPGTNNSVATEVISQHIAKHLLRKHSLQLCTTMPPVVEEQTPQEVSNLQRRIQARVYVGQTADETPAHVVQHEPFEPLPSPLAKVSSVLPLPPNVIVVKQTAQLRALQTMLHNVDTPSVEFVFAVKRLGTIIVETAVSLLPYTTRTVPLHSGELYNGLALDVKHICGVSILRSGAVFEPVGIC